MTEHHRTEERLLEPRVDENPPDHSANAPAWITFVLGGAILLVAGIGFVALYGVPGQSPGGTSQSQQQSSGAPPPPANQNATFGNAGTRETTGTSAPAMPRQ
jgi:hypothetical protein